MIITAILALLLATSFLLGFYVGFARSKTIVKQVVNRKYKGDIRES